MSTADSPSSKSKSGKSKKGEEAIDAEAEDDEFFKKWAGPLLIGPFVPAVFALIVIFCGQIIVNTFTGTCGYALQCKWIVCSILLPSSQLLYIVAIFLC